MQRYRTPGSCLKVLADLGIAIALLMTATRSPAASPPVETVTAQQIDGLIHVLEDEQARKEMVDRLRALHAAMKAGEEPPARGFGAQVMSVVSDAMTALGAHAADLSRVIGDPRKAAEWVRVQAENPQRRALWLWAIITLAIVLAGGMLAERLVRRLLYRRRRAIEARKPAGAFQRARLLLSRTSLDVIAILVFGLVAYGLLAAMRPQTTVRLVALAIINAAVISRAVIICVRVVMTPLAPNLRLIPLSDAEAAYAFVWTARFVNTAVFGYFASEVAVLLGLSPAGGSAILNLTGLLVAVMAIVFVLQIRSQIAQAIRGGIPAQVRMRVVRQWLAEAWHVLAAVYIAGVYIIWVLDIEGGFLFVARGTAVTAAAILGGRLLNGLLSHGLKQLFRVGPELRERFPELEERVNRYQPVVRVVLAGLIVGLSALIVLEAWRIPAVPLLASDAGSGFLIRLVRIGLILLLAIVAWETTRIFVGRYLSGEADSPAASQRLLTLLPLARSAILILIAAMTIMSVLSEFGVNIGPLLAGAGIVALAVGFGAQTLVKDVITGAFILMEDAIRVGDVVEVAGHRGIVEALSVRSVRHRDLSGAVHTIPFSSVDVVKNLTKEYSYYLMDIGVAYRENTDEVVSVLHTILDGMRADPDLGAAILEPLEVLGVNEFADSAVIIRARIKTLPRQQWRIGREFNRRMKHRFDELGIEIPFPHQTVYFGIAKDGTAPPARIRVEGSAGETKAESNPS